MEAGPKQVVIEPLELTFGLALVRSECNRFGGQAIKGIRWMPRHQEATKDVAKLR